ncbi:MAG: nitrogenase-stabilizing/protective protein NifW [Pseudomonadota bacterium]
MSTVLEHMAGLSAAEEFFSYLDLPYDPQVMHVHRLHILKRFQQYLAATPPEATDEAGQRAACRALLARAHADFVQSTAAQEKVFKVFQDQEGKSVPLAALRDALHTQRKRA